MLQHAIGVVAALSSILHAGTASYQFAPEPITEILGVCIHLILVIDVGSAEHGGKPYLPRLPLTEGNWTYFQTDER